MELNREHFRTIIYYNLQRQLSQQECLALLLSVFGNEAPQFKRGRVSLSDDPRVGAPKTAVTQEDVDAVRKLIIEDRLVTYREIEAKLISRWIPHLLTEEQKAARVNWCQKTLDRFNSGNSKNVYSIASGNESWIYCYESENKRQSAVWMVATFVSKAGHIATIPLNEQRTATADWYTTISSKNQPHPPYSPDLSPNDFFTFPNIKNRLRGQRFQSPEETVDVFKNAVLDLPANEWSKCFENWFERMQMCINLRGEYFEKQ
ncbi:unnamed protein product [Acanthoscelides obtectus]|uniref:Transposase n=1 Tax=Acanthoscelides obtectus TaxID=200917 RepID=A0A9P0LVH1_ACAOB|nr:unnamed protein product [Acanthoscelides obtectus]CAK1673377.1 Histone-lysine N-methyltransferase SETMAR [Acanthoscelides obtectus]